MPIGVIYSISQKTNSVKVSAEKILSVVSKMWESPADEDRA